jgi:hypothetical protein
MTLTEHEQAEISRANSSGKRPVIFVHGLWLLPRSWDPWRAYFEERGYAAIAPAGRTTPPRSRRPARIPRCSPGSRWPPSQRTTRRLSASSTSSRPSSATRLVEPSRRCWRAKDCRRRQCQSLAPPAPLERPRTDVRTHECPSILDDGPTVAGAAGRAASRARVGDTPRSTAWR